MRQHKPELYALEEGIRGERWSETIAAVTGDWDGERQRSRRDEVHGEGRQQEEYARGPSPADQSVGPRGLDARQQQLEEECHSYAPDVSAHYLRDAARRGILLDSGTPGDDRPAAVAVRRRGPERIGG